MYKYLGILPLEIWFEENLQASDTKLEENILNLVRAGTLLLLDRGFYHFNFWHQLIKNKVDFITRIKKGAIQRGSDQFFSTILSKPLDKRLTALTRHQWSRYGN